MPTQRSPRSIARRRRFSALLSFLASKSALAFWTSSKASLYQRSASCRDVELEPEASGVCGLEEAGFGSSDLPPPNEASAGDAPIPTSAMTVTVAAIFIWDPFEARGVT